MTSQSRRKRGSGRGRGRRSGMRCALTQLERANCGAQPLAACSHRLQKWQQAQVLTEYNAAKQWQLVDRGMHYFTHLDSAGDQAAGSTVACTTHQGLSPENRLKPGTFIGRCKDALPFCMTTARRLGAAWSLS
jgi:hypothetical protein